MSTPLDGTFLDVVVVGAGLGGICAAVNLRKQYPHATLGVFEKAAGIGETWVKKHTRGYALYSYSFAPNPNWSSTYVSQLKILSYIEHVADEHGVAEYILVNHECLGAAWQDEKCMWDVQFRNHERGFIYAVHCRILIISVGSLDIPRGPENIAGIQDFRGKVFHSVDWDHEVDFSDKNVVVIGNGCSANQFIPWLLSSAAVVRLTQVIRSAHWIAPKVDQEIGTWERWILHKIPWITQARRWILAAKFDLAFAAFRKNRLGRFLRAQLERSLRGYMQRTAPSKYHDLLIPTFPFGAKRPVLDHGYLAALHDPRVTLIRAENLRASGPFSLANNGDDENIPADIIILANGFKTQSLLTPMRIEGRNGAALSDLWHEDGKYPSAYMGVAVPSFPSLFMITGPNTLPLGHSTLLGIEHTVHSILCVIRALLLRPAKQDRPARRIAVRAAAHDEFNSDFQSSLDGLIISHDVRNWYVDERTGRNTLVWPGTQLEFWVSRCVRRVAWGDWEVEE
ncbi:hypothetical protein BJY00DRAFT_298280 [Aspergillus carlsbadensis]|nr:hypothetical protein BJY00DRAFT_298280 [Aspergillus carlsbadensis]